MSTEVIYRKVHYLLSNFSNPFRYHLVCLKDLQKSGSEAAIFACKYSSLTPTVAMEEMASYM